MNVINTIISENLINALGWTIVHSLWQGAAAALGFALIMLFMRRFSAGTRYMTGVIALTVILAMSLFTFVSIYQPAVQAAPPVTGGDGSQLALAGAANARDSITPAAFFRNYFNRHLPLLVAIWLLGVLVLVLRFAGGYLYNQRIKVHRNRPLPASWQNRLTTFCRRTGMQKPIKLVESALVKIPMTIGHLKPVILFPVGLVTGLPRDQVEALLAHELAHILRKDYLVNILQNLVDILFFYHPGVRWISSHVRAERENCCDDIAVSLSGDSLNVARALTNLQGYDIRTPQPAVAAVGSYGLLARVKRLLSPPAAGSNYAAGAAGASLLVVGLLTLAVSADAAAALNRDMVNDKSPAAKHVRIVDEQDDREKALEKQEIDKLLEIESRLKAEKMEMKRRQEDLLKIEAEAHRQNRELKAAEKEKLKVLEKDMVELELKRKKLGALIRKHETKMRIKERAMRAQEKAMRKQEKEMRKQEAKMRVQEKEMQKQEAVMRAQEKKMQAQEAAMRAREKAMRKQEAAMRVQEKAMRKQEKKLRKQELFLEVLEKELVQDRLITDTRNYEFQFKSGKLYINGKKQPDAVFEKYKKLYEKESGKKLTGGKGFHISRSR